MNKRSAARGKAEEILKQPRKDRGDFHQNIAPRVRQLVKRIHKQSVGWQNDADGKATHDILECVVEWQDGTADTVWLLWDVNIPTCYEDHFDFLFEKPRVDTLASL